MAAAVVLSLTLACSAIAQVETVPANHPVYIFLKRMEVKGLIDRYHDAILPISRKDNPQAGMPVVGKGDQPHDVSRISAT